MSDILTAVTRTPGSADDLRVENQVPGTMYSAGKSSVSLAVPARPLKLAYQKAGSSTLVEMSLDGGAVESVLIKDLQFHPVSGEITHVDFWRVDLTKAMHVTLPLRFVGESAAVKGLGGTLISSLQEIEVECLPKDLIHHLDVDISVLVDFTKTIHVSDLNIPSSIKVLSQPDTVVVKVVPPLSEEQLKAAEAVDISKIEVVEKGKKEEADEASADGAAESK